MRLKTISDFARVLAGHQAVFPAEGAGERHDVLRRSAMHGPNMNGRVRRIKSTFLMAPLAAHFLTNRRQEGNQLGTVGDGVDAPVGFA